MKTYACFIQSVRFSDLAHEIIVWQQLSLKIFSLLLMKKVERDWIHSVLSASAFRKVSMNEVDYSVQCVSCVILFNFSIHRINWENIIKRTVIHFHCISKICKCWCLENYFHMYCFVEANRTNCFFFPICRFSVSISLFLLFALYLNGIKPEQVKYLYWFLMHEMQHYRNDRRAIGGEY